MRSKKKDYLSIGATLLIVGGTSIAMFFPQVLGGFDKSYVELQAKQELIADNNIDLKTKENEITSKQLEFISLEEREKQVSVEASSLKKNINEEDFILDVPSFLIATEQEAYKNKVDLQIAFSQIQWGASSGVNGAQTPQTGTVGQPGTQPGQPVTQPGVTQPGTPATGQPGTQGATGDANVTQIAPPTTPNGQVQTGAAVQTPATVQTPGQTATQPATGTTPVTGNTPAVDPNAQATNQFTQEEIANGSFDTSGFDKSVVPIVIKGNYSNVRNYIKYLDGLGLIQPSSVTLVSEEKEVTAKIILNIIHGEVLR